MSFFGELYLRTTRPFFDAATSEREADYIARAFGAVRVEGPVVDLGCGHGRHASRLQNRLPDARAVIGVEADPLSLREREGSFPAVRGDLRALPFRTASLAGALAWYSTLFVFEDDGDEARVIAEVARCLRSGALLLVHTSRAEYFEHMPPSTFESPLPDGGQVKEISVWDPASSRSRGFRELATPDGRRLTATFSVHYRREPELTRLFEASGFAVRWVHGGLSGETVADARRDLIMGVERR